VNFSAPYDSTTKVVSAITAVGLTIATVASRNLIVGFLAAAVVILGYVFSPRSYAVIDRVIVVKGLIGDVRIPLDELKETRPVTPEDLKGVIRLWGSGGLFGYYGFFRTSKLGTCRWYVTNRRKMMVVVTASKTTLYSPDDVEGFIAAVRG
jgi:hypothetical protein